MTDPLSSYPHLLARKLNSWQVSNESTMLGAFLGWEKSAPLSGQPWCFFAGRGLGPEHLAGLLPVPTSVPGIRLRGRISDNMSWEDGSQRGMELPLAEPAWICSSNTPKSTKAGFVAGVGRYVRRDHSWWLRRCCFYGHFADYKVTLTVGFILQNLYVNCIAFPQEKSVCFQICFSLVPSVNAELAHHWSLTLSETWRFASSLHLFFSFLFSSASAQGNQCKVVDAVDLHGST